MRVWRLAGAVVALGLATACAPRTASVPIVTSPLHPEYVEPRIPLDLGATGVEMNHERAWQFLQAGDLRNAEREINAALRRDPDFYPTLTMSGYAALAKRETDEALDRFERVLALESNYVPAVAGKGLALQAANRNSEALDAYRQAVRLDPSLTDIARRIDVLTLRSLQVDLANAREAAKTGNMTEARRAYLSAIDASPESAFLYREVASIERQQGDLAGALDHLRRAHSLDPSDPLTLGALGDALEAQGDTEGAVRAYSEALAIEPDSGVEAKRDALLDRLELARLPAEYRAIASTAEITRAELAALIGVRLAGLIASAPARDVGVMTDVRDNWAERWIVPVARAGVMEPYANHTFQPAAIVRRVDFAQAVSRLLGLVAIADPGRAAGWQNVRRNFSDLTSGHLAFPAASVAVASGVMEMGPDGSFEPTRPVSGGQAVAAVERIEALAGPARAQASDRR
ncbi:MAG: S-layer homology domain-containing protein [Vicinamibacterales bacterium]